MGAGIGVPEAFFAQARAFLETLDRWQRVARLTGYRREADRVRHLIGESLMFLPVLGAGASPLLDIGTGAGIPGLVLRLARPGWRVTLLDASRRRTNFLRDVTRRLGLVDVAVEHRRVEAATEVADQARFRTVTMRSVASAPEALRLARPFLRRDGRLVVAVGSRSAPPEMGRLAVVEWPAPGALPWRRRFLIITGEEVGETS